MSRKGLRCFSVLGGSTFHEFVRQMATLEMLPDTWRRASTQQQRGTVQRASAGHHRASRCTADPEGGLCCSSRVRVIPRYEAVSQGQAEACTTHMLGRCVLSGVLEAGTGLVHHFQDKAEQESGLVGSSRGICFSTNSGSCALAHYLEFEPQGTSS